jgi:hypothetical protein
MHASSEWGELTQLGAPPAIVRIVSRGGGRPDPDNLGWEVIPANEEQALDWEVFWEFLNVPRFGTSGREFYVRLGFG